MEGTCLTGINVREIPRDELEQLASLARGAGCTADVTTLQNEITRRETENGVDPARFRAWVADAIKRRLVGPIPGAQARKIAELLAPVVADALVFTSVSGDPASGLRRLEP